MPARARKRAASIVQPVPLGQVRPGVRVRRLNTNSRSLFVRFRGFPSGCLGTMASGASVADPRVMRSVLFQVAGDLIDELFRNPNSAQTSNGFAFVTNNFWNDESGAVISWLLGG